jgi:tetratricopeptide (TPR) repeat protein
MFCCSLLKEVWVAAFMTWWVVIALQLLRSERTLAWAAFGVFCGIAVAFRSTLITLAAAALALPWISGPILNAPLPRRGILTISFAAGLVFALAPWSLRNFEAYHGFSPLPHNGGVVLHQAYNPENPESSIWIPDFVDYLNPSEIWRGYAAEAERRAGHELTPPQIDEYWRSQAEEFMRQHPGAVLAAVARKALKFFASVDIPINRSLQEEGLFSFIIANLPAPTPWLLALGLAGLMCLAIADQRWVLVAAPPAIALLTTALFWAEDRFRFHALAILALCSGIWLDAMVRDIQLRRFKPALASGAFSVALLGTSFALGATVNTPPLHWDQIVWGYIKMGRLTEAEKTADRVARDQPDNAPILEAEAYLAVRRQDYAAAAEAYEHALRIRPRSDQAHYNLAKLYMLLNRRQEALVQAKIALDLKPDPDYQKLITELQSAQ